LFLFILESIGTSELILIAVVALIVFGPRKLPQMVKTIGKTMAEFKSATNDFKSTWEKEVAFEEHEKKAFTLPDIEHEISTTEKTIAVKVAPAESENSLFPAPTIKELSASDIAERFHGKDKVIDVPKIEKKTVETTTSEKRDWL
jgi:Tat protein translocase TatB subunit